METFTWLEERKGQSDGSLSGGEQQMPAISRALLSRPKLLLLDEPSLGLAPLVVNELFNTIRRINHDGTTVLRVEQNVKKALKVANSATCRERAPWYSTARPGNSWKTPRLKNHF